MNWIKRVGPTLLTGLITQHESNGRTTHHNKRNVKLVRPWGESLPEIIIGSPPRPPEPFYLRWESELSLYTSHGSRRHQLRLRPQHTVEAMASARSGPLLVLLLSVCGLLEGITAQGVFSSSNENTALWNGVTIPPNVLGLGTDPSVNAISKVWYDSVGRLFYIELDTDGATQDCSLTSLRSGLGSPQNQVSFVF